MKKAFLHLLCAAVMLLLGGCSLAEPTVPGHVSLPPRTGTETSASVPQSLEPPGEPDLSEAVDINISVPVTEEKGLRPTENGAEIYLPGVYRLFGISNEFVLTVDLINDEAPLVLVLDGVHLASSFAAPIYMPRCSQCFITVTENTVNSVSGGTVPNGPDVNAALWTRGDLTFSGGELLISGELDNAVSVKDGLRLFNTSLSLSAPDDGLAGRDLVHCQNSTLSVRVGGDGIKATNTESGRVTLLDCELELFTGLDGIDGATELCVYGCRIKVFSGGGHTARELKLDDVPRVYDPLKPSFKGLKSTKNVLLLSSEITADCADDCLHSDGALTVSDCRLTLLSADDGLHANDELRISDSTANIGYCYEGLEGSSVFIENTFAEVRSSDDGVNASAPGGEFVLDGGELFMVCAGDGIDSNGSIVMNSGTLLINGPTPDYNSVLDFSLDSGCYIYGGTYVSTGASGMALVPEKTDTAVLLSLTFDRQVPAGLPIALTNSSGELLVCFTPEKPWQNFQFSSPLLSVEDEITVYLGGRAESVENCISAFLPDGTKELCTLTVTSPVTKERVTLPQHQDLK